MAKKYRAWISKCYLVTIIDEQGYDVKSEYSFCDNKKEAEEVAKRLIEEVKKEQEED